MTWPDIDETDAGDAILSTERLNLRPHRLSDAPFMMQLNSDPEVVRYTGNAAFADEAEARAVVERLAKQYATWRMGRFVVLDRRTGEKLGWCGLRWWEETEVADLGYRFFRKHWGAGYATESSRACIRYAFEDLGLPRLIATVMPENAASIRVLEKLGFHRTGPASIEGMPALGFELRRA
ncbi:GNAT family N-acetyltransferase [Sorangium sp. So ce131]|uniref:GNAT family N-acetyltransferase n=1 Tax=Sorangium sp. So ce131 TaxID=3133282 RepID=UPI003F62D797